MNDFKPQYLVQKIEGFIKKGFNRIAFFGMSYKPNVDDFRESPSVGIIEAIARNGNAASIKIVEPYANDLSMIDAELHSRLKLCEIDEALSESDVLILLVDHRFFQNIPTEIIQNIHVIDTRGVWL